MTNFTIGYEHIDEREIMRAGRLLADFMLEMVSEVGPTTTYLALGISARKYRKGMIRKLTALGGGEGSADEWASQTDEVIDIMVKKILERRDKEGRI